MKNFFKFTEEVEKKEEVFPQEIEHKNPEPQKVDKPENLHHEFCQGNYKPMADWWISYAALCLEAKEETEWQLFTGLIDAQVCKQGLKDIGPAIKQLAGLQVEDRAAYLDKLKAVWEKKNAKTPACPGEPDCLHRYPDVTEQERVTK